IENWRTEIGRFRPQLSVNVFHGRARKLNDADVTLTSYAILRMDMDALASRAWDVAVLDEAQAIKNSDSQSARAAYRIPAKLRLTLTGTPVENRLEELWSQMHFSNPGLLGEKRQFEERYAKPISAGDPDRTERLRERLRPFVLRRLKRVVAPELPPRTDLVLRCELDDAERGAYDAIRLATQKEVVARLGTGANPLAALEALLRLRQAACHRGLLPDQDAQSSSKINLLMSSLEAALVDGHKALVFSQWTGLLDRVEPGLRERGVRYLRLDGATRDRGAVVSEFQAPDGPELMLISLKAGGTGLNLTAADYVFLLDPWWNPAAEDQAADRAHRIGQERPVFVHRLVARDTVEEKILELQDKKRALADAAVGDAAIARNITRDELLDLLR
ncbi:MAG: DEAD/DEAH box helicase, partial [Myxococcota bacterium]